VYSAHRLEGWFYDYDDGCDDDTETNAFHRFEWDAVKFAPDFTISPTEGYIAQGMDVQFSITFHPQQINSSIRYEVIIPRVLTFGLCAQTMSLWHCGQCAALAIIGSRVLFSPTSLSITGLISDGFYLKNNQEIFVSFIDVSWLSYSCMLDFRFYFVSCLCVCLGQVAWFKWIDE